MEATIQQVIDLLRLQNEAIEHLRLLVLTRERQIEDLLRLRDMDGR